MQPSIHLPDDFSGRTVKVLGGHCHENDGRWLLEGGKVDVSATKFFVCTSVTFKMKISGNGLQLKKQSVPRFRQEDGVNRSADERAWVVGITTGDAALHHAVLEIVRADQIQSVGKLATVGRNRPFFGKELVGPGTAAIHTAASAVSPEEDVLIASQKLTHRWYG